MPTDTLAHTRRCERKPQTLPIGLVLKGENLKADGSLLPLTSLSAARVFEPSLSWFQESGWELCPRGTTHIRSLLVRFGCMKTS